jgi:hypothetical protein
MSGLLYVRAAASWAPSLISPPSSSGYGEAEGLARHQGRSENTQANRENLAVGGRKRRGLGGFWTVRTEKPLAGSDSVLRALPYSGRGDEKGRRTASSGISTRPASSIRPRSCVPHCSTRLGCWSARDHRGDGRREAGEERRSKTSCRNAARPASIIQRDLPNRLFPGSNQPWPAGEDQRIDCAGSL